MKPRAAAGLGWSLWALTVVMLGVGLATSLTGKQPFGEVVFAIIFPLFLLAYATVGALIASRQPGNAIGWIFLATGLLWALSGLAAGLATLAGPERSDVSWVRVLDWLGAWLFVPGIYAPAIFLLLLFPDGRLPSPRWKPVAWVGGLAVLGAALQAALVPGPMEDAVLLRTNPYAVGSPELWELVGLFSWILGIFGLVAAAVALLRRLRRSSGQQRQQIKWLAYAGVIVVSIFVLSGIVWGLARDNEWLNTVELPASLLLGLLLVPVAAGAAILRHRLYDIDIVINKTVVYGLLAAFITAVYVGLVVGIGTLVGSRGNLFLSILATAIIAVGFQPVRERARRLANRLVYGKRATPYEVLSDFGERLASSYATEDVLPRLARVVGEGVGATRSRIWLRVGRELRPVGEWPEGDRGGSSVELPADGLPSFDGEDHPFEVRHQGELLGAVTVSMPPREALTPAGEKLLQDLAAHAGLILRNVRLIEELRASRQRIVAAQDQERRRLERNIHDGAQQQLVALAVNLKLARTVSAKDPDRAGEILDRLQTEAQEAMENLRDLARGIYPPLLADKGLAAALESQARKATVPVSVLPDGIGRYPQEAEAAAYFCVLEALQNVAKYAQASRVTVRLSHENGDLVFTVTDDGKGFDPETTRRGSGLQNMADRVEALGGAVDVASSPGRGTTVIGRIPVRRSEGSVRAR
jgi:signal transduction histidine kinase